MKQNVVRIYGDDNDDKTLPYLSISCVFASPYLLTYDTNKKQRAIAFTGERGITLFLVNLISPTQNK